MGPRLRFSVGLHSLNHPRRMELWKVPGSKESARGCTSASKLVDTGRRASAAPPGIAPGVHPCTYRCAQTDKD